MPYIIETATGFPEHYYPQEVLEVNIRNHCANLLAFGVLGAKEDHLYWSVYSL